MAHACWLYLCPLFGWVILYLTTGDRFAWVSMANFLAVYLFLPLPLILLLAIPLRRVSVWVGALLGLVAFAGLWGGLFLPQLPASWGAASQPSLTVMTYNLLVWQDQTRPQIDVIRSEDPDVVFLQELSPAMAQAVSRELSGAYPYQVLQPQPDVTGMGVISKFPLADRGLRLPLEWVGEPLVLELDWNGQAITLVNFHMIPTTSFSAQRVSRDNAYRETQARALVELASGHAPAIVGGDANAPPQTGAYKILAAALEDAWMEAGFGLGHTFPGSDIEGSSRPRLAGWSVPQWLVRIDYIFCTPGWRAVQAHTARFDGVSDHRGVVAVLVRR